MNWSSSKVAFSGLESGVAGVCAASEEDRPRWFLALRDGHVRGVDLDDGQTFFEVKAADSFESATLAASGDGRFLAVVETYGMTGALYEVATGKALQVLQRGDYHPEVSGWAIGFARDTFVYASDWNRLEVLELPSMKRLAPSGEETKLDYFYGLATVSPNRQRLATFGWHWHPIGAVRIIDVGDWLSTGGDEPGGAELALTDWWDDPLCWLDDTHVALRGAPRSEDDEDTWFIDEVKGVMIVDVTTNKLVRFLPGLTTGRVLESDGERIFALAETVRVFDAQSGEQLAELPIRCAGWHRGSRTLLSISVPENELTAHWLTGTLAPALTVPQAVHDASLLVLGDALEESSVDAVAISHCRARQVHGKRCWVIEALR
jgi:hypothetical protein